MMKRICIIGNSHAACWLAAWRTYQAEIERVAHVRFFVLGGYDCDLFQVDSGVLTVDRQDLREKLCQTSGGLSIISPSEYDHFVIVSLSSGFRNLTSLFSRFGLASGALQVEEMAYVSRACLDEAAIGVLENGLAIRLRKKLGEISDLPVTLSPSPCQSEAVLLTKEGDFADICRDGRQQYLYQIYQSALLHLANKHEFSVAFQDEETMIAGGGYTLGQYSIGAINSAMQTLGSKDTSHMNVEFGYRELVNVLGRIVSA